MPEQSKIPIAPDHVEIKLSQEESVDSLCRKGFRSPYQIWWQTWLLERWDHPDGRYKLVAYKGGGLYMSDDVSDPQWKEIVDLIYGEDKRPSLFTSEDWFQLMIEHDSTEILPGPLVQQLSSGEIPTTSAEWRQFLRKFEGMALTLGECMFSLHNGRSDETLFSDTFRKNRDGSVSMVARKKRRGSR
jgi:hypothetical protein